MDDSEYRVMMKNCVKAAKAGDLGGMRDALDLLQKMDQVGFPTFNIYLKYPGWSRTRSSSPEDGPGGIHYATASPPSTLSCLPPAEKFLSG